MNEIWKPWRDGTYEVSDVGNIRRAKPGISTFVGRPVSPMRSATGYDQVALRTGGTKVRTYVHAVVMEVFVGPRPLGMVINHKDCDRQNNALFNLEYITQRENTLHSLRAGTRVRGPSKPPVPLKGRPKGDCHWTSRRPDRIAKGDRMPHTKLSVELVAFARQRVAAGEKQVVLARELDVSVGTMSRVIRGARWKS